MLPPHAFPPLSVDFERHHGYGLRSASSLLNPSRQLRELLGPFPYSELFCYLVEADGAGRSRL